MRAGTPRRQPLDALLGANLVSTTCSMLETAGAAMRAGLTRFFAALPLISASVFGSALPALPLPVSP